MDLVPSPWVIAVAVVAALAFAWFGRAYQRCPHCQRFVRRARRGWLRCPQCHRQYHRSVPRQR